MSEDLWGAFAVVLGFGMGFWNGWIWREIIARRRRRQTRHPDGSIVCSEGEGSSANSVSTAPEVAHPGPPPPSARSDGGDIGG